MKENILIKNQNFEDELNILLDSFYNDEYKIVELIKDINERYKEVLTCSVIIDEIASNNNEIIERVTDLFLRYEKIKPLCDIDGLTLSQCLYCSSVNYCYPEIYQDVIDEIDEASDISKITYLIYYALVMSGIFMMIDEYDYYSYPDITTHFNYYNNYDFEDFFSKLCCNNKEKLIMINHAQQPMFSDLYTDNNGCINYGSDNLILIDYYNIRKKELQGELEDKLI